ncbi:protein of unknown function [Azospirillum baldaniorum]|uniref:Uncharacterized protein n=1 Tax=Azospirillum baldaniorum TaxID=1064539 RepID=A0A9P1NMX4_9PROT|nr:protein of unknown function [Azospirillum baldaniorum]
MRASPFAQDYTKAPVSGYSGTIRTDAPFVIGKHGGTRDPAPSRSVCVIGHRASLGCIAGRSRGTMTGPVEPQKHRKERSGPQAKPRRMWITLLGGDPRPVRGRDGGGLLDRLQPPRPALRLVQQQPHRRDGGAGGAGPVPRRGGGAG